VTQLEPRPDFDAEVRANVRYERGLAIKAAVAIALVMMVIVIRMHWY
jgi:hypothetical protein